MAFPEFAPQSASLIKKYLSKDLYVRLKNISTPSGFTLDKAVASGVAHPDSSIGIYAGDSESYTVFARVFDPVIQEYHGLTGPPRHREDSGQVDLLNPDPEGRFIRSVRIRVARNLAALPFSCHMEKKDRLLLEEHIRTAVNNLPCGMQGTYIRYADLSRGEFERLLEKRYIFPKGDRFQESSGMNKDFPAGRGVYLSHDRAFRIWIGEEDHLRIMSLDSNADIGRTFSRLSQGLDVLQHTLSFAFDPALGFLASCPTNLGTGMRASVHIRLPRLSRQQAQLTALAEEHSLQIRGTSGEKTAVKDAVFDISNERRLGISAAEIIAGLHRGISEIIRAEKALAR